ncbi:hypothetical protein BW723_13505 [Polaribacter reichenbachii]|nr:DUF2147 domain-containing protein [Polaribacter reichenbachii]APZ48165.1 hypothetical protein BW723_13505 [Polaribacter reichenbachii]AUC20434.1 hypothetical protein BTO17_03960 [Polaribacter reichenbachii]
MKKGLFFILVFFITITMNAQEVLGKWNSRDEKTGEIDSVVEIYEKKGELFAKIIDITDPELKNELCKKCKGSLKDKPALGLHILYKLTEKNGKWVGGYGLDPRTGNYFNVYIKLINSKKLKVRGYAGIPLFGKTVYWDRS